MRDPPNLLPVSPSPLPPSRTRDQSRERALRNLEKQQQSGILVTSYWCRTLHSRPFLHSPRSQCLHATFFSPRSCLNGQSFPVDTRAPSWEAPTHPQPGCSLPLEGPSQEGAGAQTSAALPSFPYLDPSGGQNWGPEVIQTCCCLGWLVYYHSFAKLSSL